MVVERCVYGVLGGGNVHQLHETHLFGADRAVGIVSVLKQVVC